MADNNSGESICAFLLGGVVGAAVGVLLAPRSGVETRERLAGWLEENRERTREFIERESDTLREKKEQISAAWDAGKKAFRDAA